MSKMCCEVCGGASIKKMSDGLFECQSCGVQYSTDAQEIRSYGSGFTKNHERNQVGKSRSTADRYTPPSATDEDAEGPVIVLETMGHNKIETIRILQDELGWSLKQAKQCVDTVPQTIRLTDRAKAARLAAALSHAGVYVKFM